MFADEVDAAGRLKGCAIGAKTIFMKGLDAHVGRINVGIEIPLVKISMLLFVVFGFLQKTKKTFFIDRKVLG